jgi:hypothetical protein
MYDPERGQYHGQMTAVTLKKCGQETLTASLYLKPVLYYIQEAKN